MANWWDAAPVVEKKKDWWSDAPVVNNRAPQHPEFDASAIEQRKDPSRGVAATSSFVEGIPVVGPYLQSGVENVSAGIGSLLTGKPQREVRQEMGQMVDEAQSAFPGTSTGFGVAGSVIGTAPAVIAAPGVFGAGAGPLGASLLARSGMGALSGAALGGADSGVRSGGDLGAIGSGAAWGGVLGGAGPGVGDLVGKGASAIARRVRGPSTAQTAFSRAAGADAIDDVGLRLAAMGDDVMPMDLGPNLQQQAGAIAATPGRGQDIVRGAIASRNAGANQRILGALDDTLGRADLPSGVEASIRQNMDEVGKEYGKAFSKARRVDTQPVADWLESKIVNLRGDAQKAVQRVRSMLNIIGTDQLDPNPYTLFQTRQAIDDMMEAATGSKARAALAEARKMVDNRLAGSVPGIKKVDAKFSELAQQVEALGRGAKVLDSGRTAPRPTELADEFQRAAVPQNEMIGPSAVPLRLRQGARAEIDRIVGTNANDRVALQRIIKGEGDWNRARLSTLFGREKADKIINVLDRERLFSETSDTVTRNSLTASRQAAQKELAQETTSPGFFRSALNMRFGDAAADVGDKALGGVRSAAQRQANEELAQLLTTKNPKTITAAIKMVQAAQRRGDITAQRAREIIQGMAVGGAQKRRPLEITVTPGP